MKLNRIAITVPSNNEEFIGVDWGSARVGLARGSLLARLAEPLKTVPADQALAEIEGLVPVNQAVGIVVGLPRSLQGQETAQTKAVRQWVDNAKSQIKLPFYWQDEALTSSAAASRQAKDIDAAAAAAILQDFLDTPEAERVRC
ncbi:MAG TPA: Holliday junction resolvase RuvX [Candidatus Saccharimonadales bacterium]|nr:Holliday junction resolvase RuvX [Candidatus Saccharimonadales bacterium]